MARLSAFLDFLDKRAVFHRGVLVWTLWLTGEVTWWSFNFAWGNPRPGLEIAAIITAIQLPVTGLQAYVLKAYSEYRAAL